jgi:hypothetical protein
MTLFTRILLSNRCSQRPNQQDRGILVYMEYPRAR